MAGRLFAVVGMGMSNGSRSILITAPHTCTALSAPALNWPPHPPIHPSVQTPPSTAPTSSFLIGWHCHQPDICLPLHIPGRRPCAYYCHGLSRIYSQPRCFSWWGERVSGCRLALTGWESIQGNVCSIHPSFKKRELDEAFYLHGLGLFLCFYADNKQGKSQGANSGGRYASGIFRNKQSVCMCVCASS